MKLLMLHKVIVTLTVAILCSHCKDITVNTKSGQLRGTFIETNISNFYAFFSIPYAKPPVDDLRFKPAQPVEAWSHIRDATKEGSSCIQSIPIAHSSEDCLTQNIYTNDITARNRSVLVWLHGGALEFGTGDLEVYGPHYLVQKNIIIVTVKFRVGIMGFLNLGIRDAPGNVGLMDAVLALKWIQQNIENFGGNPRAVTVAGQSSGGVMVHSLLLSPMSQGLFHQLIIESGTSLSFRLYHHNPASIVPKILDHLNGTFTNEELLEHLRVLNTKELLDIQAKIKSKYMKGYAVYFPFAMSIQKTYKGQESFLTRHPIEIMKDADYNAVPILIGFNSDEGLRLEAFLDVLDNVNEHFEIVVPTDIFDIDDHSQAKLDLADSIKRFYLQDKDLSRETFAEYVKLGTDSWYAFITDYVIRLHNKLHSADKHKQQHPTYYYVFGVDGAYNYKIIDGYSTQGSGHSDELGYIWHMEVLAHLRSNDDFSDLTRERMVAMWSNFVKYGNPTPQVTELLPVIWETVEYPQIKYLVINKTLSIKESPIMERMRFWQHVYGYDII